jgi:hypothetical protein
MIITNMKKVRFRSTPLLFSESLALFKKDMFGELESISTDTPESIVPENPINEKSRSTIVILVMKHSAMNDPVRTMKATVNHELFRIFEFVTDCPPYIPI